MWFGRVQKRIVSFPLALRLHLHTPAPPPPPPPAHTPLVAPPAIITICLLKPLSLLGLEILTQLLFPSFSSIPLTTNDPTASKMRSPSHSLQASSSYRIKAIVEPIYNARDLDDLIQIQNLLSSSSQLHQLEIFEVNSLIPNSYTKIIQDCDYVREDLYLATLPSS